MAKITTVQSHQVMAALAVNTDWESIDFKNSGLQDFIVRNQKEVGRQFTEFLKNGRKIVELKTIKIDRTNNPLTFSGGGHSIEEQDKKALVLTEVDLNNVRLETMLKPDETYINGEEKLKRLKMAGHIRLDAKIFQTLLENKHLIPEKWKEKTNGNITFIFFDGTVLRYSHGDRCVLYFYWDGGEWRWDARWLAYDFDARSPSAVLPS